MSLIVTSNNPNEDQLLTGGLSLPYSYTNNLNDPLKIPANSEIAVQSVKINKNGKFNLDLTNSVFGFYFGEELSETQTFNDSNSIVMSHACIDAEENTKLSGLPVDIAEFAENAGNRCLFHPNLLENASSAVNRGFQCEVKRNASDLDFEGFKFTVTNPVSASFINQRGNMEDDLWRSVNNFAENVADYNDTTFTLENQGNDDDCYVYEGLPLSHANGSFTISGFQQENASLRVGLSRCTRAFDLDGNPAQPPLYIPEYYDSGTAPNTDPAVITYYDYILEIENNASGTINVYHTINENGVFKTVEFDYTSNASGTGTGGKFNAKDDDVTSITWNIQNERVKLHIVSKGASQVLADGTNASGARNLKPTNMCTRFLYPKIQLESSAIVTIDEYYGVDIKDFVYGDLTRLAGGRIKESFHDFYAHFVNKGKWPSLKAIDMDRVKSTDFTNQLGLASNRVNLKPIMFFAPDTVLRFFTQNCNSRRVFGFPERPKAVATTEYSVGNTVTFVSDDTPTLKNTQSYFVRLKNMTFDSTNFAIGQKSKILYHLPSFSNNGESTGSLYFEPTSVPLYVDLHNTTDIYMNSIEVDIVKIDESPADDLTGRTVVVLHIRQKTK